VALFSFFRTSSPFSFVRVSGLLAGVACLAGAAAACSGSGRSGFDPEDASADVSIAPLPDAGPKPPEFTDATVDTAIKTGPAEVFGHSGAQLYRLDPDTKGVTVVGTFSGCTGGSVIDIALDESSNMFGTTFGGLFSIDKTNAKCTKIADGSFPNSLSFVPKGTLDPAKEALVGYVGANYIRIDTVTGAITNVGSLGDARLISSGDIVSVIGGPTYLTVKSAGGDTRCDAADCLVEVNPQTGAITKNLGVIAGKQEVFGVAFWAGAIYGFSNGGSLFQVLINGSSLSVADITIPQAPSGLSFFGAGSTTSAPVLPK